MIKLIAIFAFLLIISVIIWALTPGLVSTKENHKH